MPKTKLFSSSDVDPSNFEVLRQAAERLNRATDEAQELVSGLEKFLSVTCSVGVSAFTLVCTHQTEHGDDIDELLWYRKHGDRFRIMHVLMDGADEREAKPWADLSRVKKIDTLPHLPLLMNAITKQVHETASKAEHALASIRPLVDASFDL